MLSGLNWNLEMLVFVEEGKPENLEKNPRSKDENQQQTQPTSGINAWNQTWATLIGDECPHHCTIPAPQISPLGRIVHGFMFDLVMYFH